MGVLARFERRLGSSVEGGIGRVFRSRVEPVELAVALKKEADANRTVGPVHTLVPNQYEVDLGPADYERLAPYRYTLADELAEMVREHASEQRYTFVGPVEVALVRAEDLRTGSYRIGSRVEASAAEPPPARVEPPRWTPPPPPRPIEPLPAAAVYLPDPPAAEPPRVDLTAAMPSLAAAAPEATVAIPRTFGRLEMPDGERVTVGDTAVVLGRGHEADVRLADASVSRRHATVRAENGRAVIEDLGSTNGTTVNGERVSRAVLVDGDQVALGAAAFVYRS